MKLGYQIFTVFILEDNQGHFEDIKNAIEQYYKHSEKSVRVKVLPEVIDRNLQVFRSWSHVINSIDKAEDKVAKQKILKEIIVYCQENDANIFVLDNAITSDTDETGIEFANALISEAYNGMNFEIIIVSNAGKADFEDRFDKNLRPHFVDKESESFPNLIIAHIEDLIFMHSQGPDQIQAKGFYNFKRNLKRFGFGVALSFLWHYLKYSMPRLIDKCILATFYLLIFITTFYSGYQIVAQLFWHKNPEKLEGTHFDLSPSDETHILSSAEHLFLYLLPIFILFGFFNYYKNNLRISFLEGNKTKINENYSTSAIRLSKTLFISSMIAFILIKTIEELFFYTQTLEYNKLIAAGALLILLMFYFFFLERRNEKH